MLMLTRSAVTLFLFFFFFFSSRRRHTRFKCDWSSDVCSSDLFITVTTEELRTFYKKINPQIWTIPNAFNDYNYQFRNCFSEKKVVNWRGSDTHRGDLDLVKNKIWENARTREDWTWSFIGGGDSLWSITHGLHQGDGIKKYSNTP